MTTHTTAPAAPATRPDADDTLGHIHPALAAAADPRDVFLTAEQVHAYLGLGRGKRVIRVRVPGNLVPGVRTGRIGTRGPEEGLAEEQ